MVTPACPAVAGDLTVSVLLRVFAPSLLPQGTSLCHGVPGFLSEFGKTACFYHSLNAAPPIPKRLPPSNQRPCASWRVRKTWRFRLFTGVPNLQALTMRLLKGICSSQALLRACRVWCPRCYSEREQTGGYTIEPLLWPIDAVAVCLDHRCRLNRVCPACGRNQPVLAGRSRPGC